MQLWLRWIMRTALVGLSFLLIWYVWQAVTTYQSMTAEQIAIEQQKEQAQHAQFEQQRQAMESSGERPKHGFFDQGPFSQVKRVMHESGSDAVLMVWFAMGFWLAIEAFKRFAPHVSDAVKRYIRTLIAFFREHHRAVGWLALGFTAVHSIYYLALWLVKDMQFDSLLIWSGIASFIPFLVLAGYGEWLERHGRDKSARKVHFSMALLMLVGMVVHDFGSLGKILILIGVSVGIYLISRVIARFEKPRVPATME